MEFVEQTFNINWPLSTVKLEEVLAAVAIVSVPGVPVTPVAVPAFAIRTYVPAAKGEGVVTVMGVLFKARAPAEAPVTVKGAFEALLPFAPPYAEKVIRPDAPPIVTPSSEPTVK